MIVFRSPVVSLMPDLTPSNLRSKANGLINFMGGVGAAVSLYFGAFLYNIDPSIPFIFFSIVLVIIILLYLWKIKEPEQVEKEEKMNLITIIKDIFKLLDRNILFILLAIFFWFFGFSGVETFFTLYGKNFLYISESLASQRLAFFSVSFLLLAIPSGYLASKIGRKRTICTGISGLLLVFILLIYLRNINHITYCLLLGGVFWALININSYPMIVDSSEGKIGTLTGIYYFFSTLPAILSPMVVGKIIEMAGYGTLFITASISLILSLFFMIKVKQ
ncbi:MAG: SLC45 family MFS transporter, partial [Halanaerobiaceae bacterium]|nr:SLC45 family MFS transporter [Halanaerobiaceae bacterium]